MKTLTITLALLLLAAPVWAQKSREAIYEHPGYFDFSDLEKYSDGDELIEVDLTQPLLSFVGAMAQGEDPELGELLKQLLLVNVRVFSYDRDDADDLRDSMESLVERLQGDSWENIVRVRGEEAANVFVKLEGDENDIDSMEFIGLAILAMEDEEAVAVNVVGNFSVEDIARVGRHFDIPHMEGMRDEDRRRSRRSRGEDEGR